MDGYGGANHASARSSMAAGRGEDDEGQRRRSDMYRRGSNMSECVESSAFPTCIADHLL